jgi:hypothetical protein
MTKDGGGILYSVAFGSRQTRGNEKRLHSYLGEGFAGDWAINKIRRMCFGRCFVWVTDCYAVKFILSYDGSNPAILRLQMRLMCWDVDIVHRSNNFLVDADYWSWLGKDLCYDPTFREYLQFVLSFRTAYPHPQRCRSSQSICPITGDRLCATKKSQRILPLTLLLHPF